MTWLRTGSTTVTAQTAEGLNATLAVSNTSLTPQVLRGVLLSPRNVLLKTVPSVTNISVTGVYTDGNARPLRNATFTTSIPQARVVDLAGRYQLDLASRPPTTSFNVTATVDGKSDTTTFYVIP